MGMQGELCAASRKLPEKDAEMRERREGRVGIEKEGGRARG